VKKRSKGVKDEHAALRASPEFKAFEDALDRILKVPKEVVDRQMAELHPKRPRKSPDS